MKFFYKCVTLKTLWTSTPFRVLGLMMVPKALATFITGDILKFLFHVSLCFGILLLWAVLLSFIATFHRFLLHKSFEQKILKNRNYRHRFFRYTFNSFGPIRRDDPSKIRHIFWNGKQV